MNESDLLSLSKFLKLDKKSEVPLYIQLGDAICSLAEEGLAAPNEKLPPIRKLSRLLDVNNITVVNAYKYLKEKKIAYSIGGSGTYISELAVPGSTLPKGSLFNSQKFHPESCSSANSISSVSSNKIINFASSSSSPELFPVDEFKTLFNKVLDRDRGNAFGYEQIQGYGPLREEICVYAAQYGITASPDKIQIISGAQQGIDLISKAMLSHGDCVIVECPTYYGALGAFLSRGANIIEVDMDKDGMNMNRLLALIKAYKPKIVYTMPYFQTPTCYSMSMEKKRILLEYAQKYDFYIIEEDNQSDFNFSKVGITPLKALDYKNKVIYVKSFSKLLMPGLRLGFMILPRTVLERVLTAKYTSDIETSGFIQRAFQLYLNSDSWCKHISKMFDLYKKRYRKMKFAVGKYLKGRFEYEIPLGGSNFWLKITKDIKSNDFCEILAHEGVIVQPGSMFSLNSDDLSYIRLSFANVDEDSIEEGIKRLGSIFDKN